MLDHQRKSEHTRILVKAELATLNSGEYQYSLTKDGSQLDYYQSKYDF